MEQAFYKAQKVVCSYVKHAIPVIEIDIHRLKSTRDIFTHIDFNLY